MIMFFSVLAMASAPVIAEPAHTKTIIIDKRDSCGEGRIAKFYQDRAEHDARKIKRELESAGERVKIVRLNPGIVLSNQKGVMVIAPRC